MDGGDAGVGGGVQLPDAGKRECGGTICNQGDDCCADDGACGRLVPPEVFVNDCVASAPYGGEIDSDCASSPDFCARSLCQSFAGCRQPDGDCGYWVDEATLAGGEETVILQLGLGCVDVSMFQPGS